MDALNLRVLVDLSGGNAARVKERVDAINASPYKDRFRVFANVAWEGAGGAGWQEAALNDLRQAVKNGGAQFIVVHDTPINLARQAATHSIHLNAGTLDAFVLGLAGEFSGIYPRESPGGWQLIGRSGGFLLSLHSSEQQSGASAAAIR